MRYLSDCYELTLAGFFFWSTALHEQIERRHRSITFQVRSPDLWSGLKGREWDGGGLVGRCRWRILTFPHVRVSVAELACVEQEAGAVLRVAITGAAGRTALVGAQHLVDGGAVLVGQCRIRRVAILLRV